MAPSKSLPAAKLSLVLSYFRTTALAYTLKDLEKSLPAAAGISGIVVKDYLAALVADSLLCVEKIGSGNWYWSFPADAKKQKLAALAEVSKEQDKVVKALKECEKGLQIEKERLSGDGEDGRSGLIDSLKVLEERKARLVCEVEGLRSAKGAETVMDEKETLRLKTNTLIDNLYTLEGHLKSISGGDQEIVARVKESIGLEDDMDYVEP